VPEVGNYITPTVKNGVPEKPVVTTLNTNLVGTIYSKGDPTNIIQVGHHPHTS
jgi:hypothetical protein